MQNSWLNPDEQEEVINLLLRFGLIKFSNKRDLPLKSGGFTDIYINLRDARNNPKAISGLANYYANALRRLRINRFVEVPDSVSCFAGPISLLTKLPYLTIRESPKTGRVVKPGVIGNPDFGDRVAILDDVITNGDSKIVPYQECLRMGLGVESLVVLVDRQQGWQKKLAELGIDLNVWAGMTLHDVRRRLIENGTMVRCDSVVEDKNPIIVALDGKSWEEILPLLDSLRTSGCVLKVNDLMFDKGMEWLLPNLSVYGEVMADLKGHDIPNTLKNIAKRLSRYAPWAVTIHASGGREMIKASVDALKGTKTKVLAVTVLTSIDENTSQEIYSRLPVEQVRVLARIAHESGAHGFVCSPEEVEELKKTYPDMLAIVPGVRSAGKDVGDQKRTDTPSATIKRGANRIVMGRQILEAKNPVAEVERVMREELEIA